MRWIINFEDGKSPCRVNQASSVVGEHIYSFGGYCQQTAVVELKKKNSIDVNVLNTLTFKWQKRPQPSTDSLQYLYTPYFRYGHTCVTYNDLIFLWGGRADWTNILDNLLYCYYPKKHKWRIVDVNGISPDGRDGHSACTIDSKSSMYIFGGYVQKTKRFSNDIYEFNFETSSWSLIEPKTDLKPYWRDFHTASPIGMNIFIFGGRMDKGGHRFTGESFYSNDLFCFNIITKTWTQIKPDTSSNNELDYDDNSNNTGPSGRRSHSSVSFKNKIIVFGGFQENIHRHYNDLYEFDTEKFEWKRIIANGEVPSPRRRHSCCVIANQMFLFGGTGPSKIPILDSQSMQVEMPVALPNSNTNTLNENINNNNNNSIVNQINPLDRLMIRLERNFLYVQNASRDRSNLNLNELNSALFAGWNRLEELRNRINQNERILNPFYNNNDEVVNPNQAQVQFNFDWGLFDNPNNNQNNNNINNNSNNNNNNPLPTHQEEPEQENIQLQVNNIENNLDVQMQEQQEELPVVDDEAFFVNGIRIDNDDDNDNEGLEFDDSDSEDLINEETEDEDENLGLVSLSDLHVLQLDIPPLRLLSEMEIIKSRIEYDKNIPKDLINEISCLTSQ